MAQRLIVFILAAIALPVSAQSAHHSLEALRADVSAFLQNHYQGHAKKLSVDVHALDPRLNLSRCQLPLAFELRDLQDNGGTVSVKTQCRGERPWAIYVTAEVALHRDILVAGRALKRGQKLSEADLKTALTDTSELHRGFYINPQNVVGLQLQRPLNPGEPLRPGLLQQPLAIDRGDVITLESNSGGIQVATKAEALESGHVGEQIRVKNLSSERVIRATIVGKQRASVIF